MSLLVKDLLGMNTTKDVGIEVELESLIPLQSLDVGNLWTTERDGSLRYHSVECVSRVLSWSEVSLALSQLDKYLSIGRWVPDSERTSVHVHLNMLHCTPVQVFNFTTTFWLLEHLLLCMCAESRRANLFCISLKHAEGTIDRVLQGLLKKGIKFFNTKNYDEGSRYAALNLQSLNLLGTLEVRCLEGTLDTSRINRWVLILRSILEYAKTKKTPEEVLEDFYDNFLYSEYKRKYLTNVLGRYTEVPREIFDGINYIHDTNTIKVVSKFVEAVSWNLLDGSAKEDTTALSGTRVDGLIEADEVEIEFTEDDEFRDDDA